MAASPLGVLSDAVLITALGTTLALGVNTLRDDGITLLPEAPPRILVPCPQLTGDASPLPPAQLRPDSDLVIDARGAGEFATWHAPGARSIPYDFLDPIAASTVVELISSGAPRLVVYGDGRTPDSGEQMADELLGAGVRNVFYIPGGADTLRTVTP